MLLLNQERRKIVEIPIDKITPNPSQPRRIFSQAELDSLSASIQGQRAAPADPGAPQWVWL